MKYAIYGIAGILAIGTAIPAFANSAPAMQSRSTEVIETESSRTVIVSETTLYGQQVAGLLDGVEKASTFRNLMAANGLSMSLRDDDDGYTAFVPVNSAFEGMSLPSAPAAGKVNPQAQALLAEHIVDSKFDVNLLHGQRDNITSLSGKTITVSKAGKSYFANGHLIVDRKHSPEGIVYFIEDVISSPDIANVAYNPADATK